jgi:hypothetical protein
LWNTLVRAGEVTVVLIVERYELLAYLQKGLFVAMLLWQRTLNELIDAIAYEARVVFYLVCRKSACR